MRNNKWVKYILGGIGAIVAGGAIMLGGVMVGYPAISQLVGLAVAQSATLWNNVIDAAKGDSQASGILGMSPYVWNGVSFDRVRGDIANGMDVDVTRISGSVTPADAYANPTTANQMWALNGVFNGTTWDRVRTATADALASTGLVAAANVTYNGTAWDRWRGQVSPAQGGSVTGTLFNTQTTNGAITAVVTTIAALANTRTHVYSVEARCGTAADTSGITITDGGTTIWTTGIAEVVFGSNYKEKFNPGLTGATNSAIVITLATCTVGTGTLIVQADRF